MLNAEGQKVQLCDCVNVRCDLLEFATWGHLCLFQDPNVGFADGNSIIKLSWGQFLKRLANRLTSARKVYECLLSFFKKVASGFSSTHRSKSAKGPGPLANFHSQVRSCEGWLANARKVKCFKKLAPVVWPGEVCMEMNRACRGYRCCCHQQTNGQISDFVWKGSASSCYLCQPVSFPRNRFRSWKSINQFQKGSLVCPKWNKYRAVRHSWVSHLPLFGDFQSIRFVTDKIAAVKFTEQKILPFFRK